VVVQAVSNRTDATRITTRFSIAATD